MLGKTTNRPEQRRDRSPSEAHGDASVISKGTRIVGDCTTEGHLLVHGMICGNATARGLELSPTGSAEGDVTAFEGSDSNHTFVIEGTVEGTVRAPHVEVRRDGVVTRGVEAVEAVIHGRVQGGILARNRLVLEHTATVEGDVRACRLALKEGGQVNGTIRMGARATTGLSSENKAHEAPGANPRESELAPTAPSEPRLEGPQARR